MGRNGAGKSTLLRHAAGLMSSRPGAGSERAGRVALLLQNPTDYLVHERGRPRRPPTSSCAASGSTRGRSPGAIRASCRAARASGWRSRSCSATAAIRPRRACASTSRPAGWTASARPQLAELLDGLDAAVLVATHDPEFVAAFADRVVLLADGAVIADGTVARGARRRQLLRHRDGADPRRAGGRADAGGGRQRRSPGCALRPTEVIA